MDGHGGGAARSKQREDTSPRDPERGALHRILRDNLATFLARREEDGSELPKFVVRELRGYIDCGVLGRGCAHFRCEGCGLDRVVALSCKGRGFCPRCGGRRMTELARHLVEEVFPHERLRQWVLSFPFELRAALGFHHSLVLAFSRILTREIARRYCRLAEEAGLRSPRTGSVTVIQRFQSDLRLNVHLHAAHLDGAYGINAQGVEVFFTAPAPSPAEVEEILAEVVKRVLALLEAREGDDDIDQSERALAAQYLAATRLSGSEKHAPEEEDDELTGQVILSTRRKARIDGFDLDAETAVGAHEHERREQLLRYFLRPPLSLDRLTYVAPGLVVLALKKPWQDRTTHVSMTPDVFLGRLASLVPRPHANTILYYGVLAPNAKGRKDIVPKPPKPKRQRQIDARFASLMQHSFGIDVLGCRRCGARMTLVAVIHDRKEVRRLLQNLRVWSDPLPVHPARGPPDEPETFDFP